MQRLPDFDEQLVDLIYATIFGEAGWRDFLLKLDESLPAGATGLFYHDANRAGGAIEINTQLSTEWIDDYARYYSRINPWMPAAARRKIGVGVVAEQMLSREYFVRTEFYNDCFRPIGLESAVGITIDREDDRMFLLSTLTSSADADSNRETADRLTRLAPHLRRAFGHFQSGYRDKAIAEVGRSVLDAIDIGVIVVGHGGKPKSISPVAAAVMDRTAALSLGLAGTLKFADAQSSGILAEMLKPDYAGPRVVTHLAGATRISLIKVVKDRQSAFFEGPTVVVTLEHRDMVPVIDEQRLQADYAITNSELRVLKAIFSGQSVKQIAAAELRSTETIRTHLKSLYLKTGTSRQADLVRFAMRWARH